MEVVRNPYFFACQFNKYAYLYHMTDKQIENKRKEFGRILRTERESRRLKITEAAALIGTTHQSLSNLEEGKHFNFCFAVKVCDYYGLDLKIINRTTN